MGSNFYFYGILELSSAQDMTFLDAVFKVITFNISWKQCC